MIVHIEHDESDDDRLITALNGFLANLVEEKRPEEVHFIRIRNWFDYKWLGYSGKGVVDFPGGGGLPGFDVALDEFRQTDLTIPPFNPNRVMGQRSFRRVAESQYQPVENPPLHVPTVAWRNKNLHRRIRLQADSAIFAWFSSGSLPNGRASLMVYAADQGTAAGWYASFVRDPPWRIHGTKGVDRARIEAWLPKER